VAADPKIRNIRPEEPDLIEWDSADPAQSLRNLRNIAEKEGQKAIDWYWKAKRWKRIPSQWIQFVSLLLAAAAGIIPILVLLFRNSKSPLPYDSGLLASLSVGLAAALLGLDKAFGYSSGWTRYVLTATSMTKLLHEFRMDWVALQAAAAVKPTLEQQSALIQRAKEFISTIQGLVAQETKDWAAEFQSNMAQMEKDLKVQLEALQSQTDKAAKDRSGAAKPGAIELTVTNADKTDDFSYGVVLEGEAGTSSDSVSNAMVWTRIKILPGQYKLTVSAKCKGKTVATSTVVDVQPGTTKELSVTLPNC
jgi:hypothetical protein